MQGGCTKIVRVILDADAEVSTSGTTSFRTPLQEAVAMSEVEVVCMLLKAGADVNPPAYTCGKSRGVLRSPLKMAAAPDNVEMFNFLWDSGLDRYIHLKLPVLAAAVKGGSYEFVGVYCVRAQNITS